ncbi:Gti1/Pac2 family-domain-containing protein [Nemania serpens]|nr:Gti1/Pac2 family-domain-containing protein [Nemania serpens]
MAGQPAGANPLSPTFQGFISSTMDALILFEACLSGRLSHVPRRPHDRERPQLIRSGNVFIYEEHSSGIKRWTDGVPWSPSRILGNFLLYRELDKPFQPGEKKRAMKRNKPEGVTKPLPSPRSNSIGSFGPGALSSPATMAGYDNMMNGNDAERAYIGSLIDSYQFKENGLIKKTISVQHKGVHHHLVSYYSLDDIKDNALKTVTETEELRSIVPRSALISSANFRSPIDDSEYGVLSTNQCVMPQNMEYMNGIPRSLSIPATQPYGQPPAWGNPHYAQGPSYSMPQTLQPPTTHYGQQMVPAYGYNPAYGPPRPSGYSSLMQATRRHSGVPSTSGANQLGYSTATGALLANGSGLAAHGLASSSYLNGDIFNASAASAVAENASSSPAAGYGATGTISQSNGAHNIGNSASHSTAGYGAQLSNGYEQSMGRLGMQDFGDTVQESAGPSFGSTSTSTTPPNLSLGLDHHDMPSTEDQEWDNPPSDHIPKPENDW